MANALADAGLKAVFSYAGRTGNPLPQPLPVRVGGFGGITGLLAFLRNEGISQVIDATHPFAAEMSGNAIAACAETGVPLIAIERPQWQPVEGDLWHRVADIPTAAATLPDKPARVFLTIGKRQLDAFAAAPQHHYLVRVIDVPDEPLPFPNADLVAARGPFTYQGDLDLMRSHNTERLVTKNAGGDAARGKLDVARYLGLPVIMVDRPPLPARQAVTTVAEVMDWLHRTHDTARLGV